MAINNDFLVKNGLVVKTTATIQSTLASTNTTTGALVVTGGVGIGGAISLPASQTYSANFVTTATSATTVVIDTFSSTQYRSGKYQLQMSSPLGYHVCEVAILHDDASIDYSQYGEVIMGATVANFTATISAGVVSLSIIPTVSISTATSVSFVRTLINNLGSNFTPDLLSGIGAEDLMTESGSFDLML